MEKHFHKNTVSFRFYATFEADKENDYTQIGDKTTNTYKQNAVCNGYYIVSELDLVSKKGYYESPLGYDNVDWFADEVIKLEKNWLHILNTLKKVL